MIKPGVFIVATCLLLPAVVAGQGKPLTIAPLTQLTHRPTSDRARFDTLNGTYSMFATDGKIEYDPGTRNFILSWNGADGARQKLVWDPPPTRSTSSSPPA